MNTNIKKFADQCLTTGADFGFDLEKFAELVIAAERERLAEQFTVDYRAFRFDSNQIVTDVYEYIANGGK